MSMKSIVLDALSLKEQSLKRAQKSATPRFAPVYEQELNDLAEVRIELGHMTDNLDYTTPGKK